jgi:hypothetical protein
MAQALTATQDARKGIAEPPTRWMTAASMTTRVAAVPLFPPQGRVGSVLAPTRIRSAHTVRNATVGGIRDARTAGIRPANAPMRMAEAMPPVHASTGITMSQFFELA